MTKELSDQLSWKIPQIGWRNSSEITKALTEFKKISSGHLLEISLDEYANLHNKRISDFIIKKTYAYCQSYISREVEKDMCLLATDCQRQNMRFDAVIALNYSVDEVSVTLTGIAVKLI